MKKEKKINKRLFTREDMQQVIKQEADDISSRISFNEKKDLVLKLNKTEVRRALVYDDEEKKYTPEFKPNFVSFLENFRIHKVSDANTLAVEIDKELDPELRGVFQKAWREHFGSMITSSHRTMKQINRRIKLFAIFGSLIMLAIITLNILQHYMTIRWATTDKPYTDFYIFCAVFNVAVYVFGWGMMWEMFTLTFVRKKEEKLKLTNLFLLYKACITRDAKKVQEEAKAIEEAVASGKELPKIVSTEQIMIEEFKPL